MPCTANDNVGLLFDVTGRGDKSFNDAAAAGLDQGVDEFGVVASESTPTGDADRAERLEGLVSQGNGLVIGVGFLWGDALTAGATAHTDVCFAIVDSVVELPNVASLVFAEEQGSFLVGAAAALKSQTGTVGFIGGVENDLITDWPLIVVRLKIGCGPSSKPTAPSLSPFFARSSSRFTASLRRYFGSVPPIEPEMSTIASRSTLPVAGVGGPTAATVSVPPANETGAPPEAV